MNYRFFLQFDLLLSGNLLSLAEQLNVILGYLHLLDSDLYESIAIRFFVNFDQSGSFLAVSEINLNLLF